TAPSGLFIAAVLVIMALPVTRTIQDPDFWWHLRAGQLIIQHGGLLGNDPFTYTVVNHHWTMHEWLNEVFFAVEYAIGGLGLIVLILSAVTWLGFLPVMQTRRPRSRHAHCGDRGIPDMGAASPDDHLRVLGVDTAAGRTAPRQGRKGHVAARPVIRSLEQ